MRKADSAKFIVINLALLIAASATLEAGEIGFEITADFNSKYIWRGQNLSDDPVFQPGISAGYEGLTVSTWGNMDLTSINGNSGDFSELDHSLDYSAKMPWLEGAAYSVGVICYGFPGTESPDTTEVYWGLSLDVPLSPSIKWYLDVDEIDGSYLQFGLGRTFEKLVTWSDDCYCGLQLGASAAWGNSAYNKSYFGINQGELNDLTLSAGLPVCIKLWTIRPSINYSTILSDKIRSATLSSDNLWGGISVSRSF